MATLGCSGERLTIALEEPLRVDGAQFRKGELPGSPPLTPAQIAQGVAPRPPHVTTIDANGFLIAPGQVDKPFSGRATRGSTAVGLRFADLGSGYWVIPTGSADIVNDGELLWSARTSFGGDPSPGKHTLLASAIDARGRAGTQASIDLCLLPAVPDNGNACDPSIDPPKLVISLAWDTPVDLDLRVVTPSGKVVDAKRPTTATADTDHTIDPKEDGVGVIDNDSNAACQIDRKQRENLVFQSRPPAGKYLVYASLFDACGQSDVGFELTLHSSVPASDEGFTVAETLRETGELAAVHASGGTSLGTFVTQFVIE
jgi:hypothetical protein